MAILKACTNLMDLIDSTVPQTSFTRSRIRHRRIFFMLLRQRNKGAGLVPHEYHYILFEIDSLGCGLAIAVLWHPPKSMNFIILFMNMIILC